MTTLATLCALPFHLLLALPPMHYVTRRTFGRLMINDPDHVYYDEVRRHDMNRLATILAWVLFALLVAVVPLALCAWWFG